MNTKLSPRAAGLAVGVYLGVALFIVAIIARLTGYCKIVVSLMSTFYIGYTYTFLGSLMGLVWGFADGFVASYIVVWLYNMFARHTTK